MSKNADNVLRKKRNRSNDKNMPKTDEKQISKDPKISTNNNDKLIVLLEGASLELGNVKKNPHILCSDEDFKYIKSLNKNPDNYRPDIVHQCLLSLFDSPINKSNNLKVYIHTTNNILIDINPITKLPRTFKRFCGLFTQLLLKNEIKTEENEVLLKVIDTKIEDLFSKDYKFILLSHSGRLVDLDTYCKNTNNCCYIIGANHKGNIDTNTKYKNDCISISSYELDSNIVCAKICNSFEKKLNIL